MRLDLRKRGFPHTFDLQASTIHNLRCVKAMDLEIVQFRLTTWFKNWWKFQVFILIEHQVMVSQI